MNINTQYRFTVPTITGIVLMALAFSLTLPSCSNPSRPTAIVYIPTPSIDSIKAVHDSLLIQYNAANSSIDDLRTRNNMLDSEGRKKEAAIQKLKKDIAVLSKKNNALASKLRKAEQNLGSTQSELDEKTKTYAEDVARLHTEKASLAQLLADLSAKYNSLKELGSVLHASNIRILPLHTKRSGREKKTVRARKLNVLKVYFDIDENRIAEDGNKQLYLSIKAPDGKLLTGNGKISGSFKDAKGNDVSYSVEKDIMLKQNEPVMDLSVDLKQEGEHQKGDYRVAIYNGGYKIGSGSVALR